MKDISPGLIIMLAMNEKKFQLTIVTGSGDRDVSLRIYGRMGDCPGTGPA